MTAAFRAHMAKVPTSVVVAAALEGDDPIGMVVGTFTSVSLVPPMVGFLGDLGSSTMPRLVRSGRISFSVLASDAFPSVTDAFRRPPPERFDGIDWEPSDLGLPRVKPAVLYVEGPVIGVAPAGDHQIVRVYPEVIEVGEGESPLVFWGGRMMGVGEATTLSNPVWQLGRVNDKTDR